MKTMNSKIGDVPGATRFETIDVIYDSLAERPRNQQMHMFLVYIMHLFLWSRQNTWFAVVFAIIFASWDASNPQMNH